VNRSGDVYAAGTFAGTQAIGSLWVMTTGGAAQDAFLAKIDPTGAVLSLSAYGGAQAPQVNGNALALDATGPPYVGGTYTGMLDLGMARCLPRRVPERRSSLARHRSDRRRPGRRRSWSASPNSGE
jgi:hypothetical protein